jgi:hypothetical protein
MVCDLVQAWQSRACLAAVTFSADRRPFTSRTRERPFTTGAGFSDRGGASYGLPTRATGPRWGLMPIVSNEWCTDDRAMARLPRASLQPPVDATSDPRPSRPRRRGGTQADRVSGQGGARRPGVRDLAPGAGLHRLRDHQTPGRTATSRGRSGRLTTSIETIDRGGASRANTRYGHRPTRWHHDPAQS